MRDNFLIDVDILRPLSLVSLGNHNFAYFFSRGGRRYCMYSMVRSVPGWERLYYHILTHLSSKTSKSHNYSYTKHVLSPISLSIHPI